MSEVKVNKVSPRSGTTVTLGDSGDTFSVPTGVTLDTSSGTITVADGSIANAKLANFAITLNGTSVSLGGSASIGTTWPAVITADPANAVAGNGYFCNTTAGAFTVTLPTSATRGDEISFIDYAGTFDTNNLTIGRNGHNIQGDASDLTVSTERAGFTLVYVDSTQGWLLKDK